MSKDLTIAILSNPERIRFQDTNRSLEWEYGLSAQSSYLSNYREFIS